MIVMKNLILKSILVSVFSLFAIGNINAQEEIKPQIETTVEEAVSGEAKKTCKKGDKKACCAAKKEGKKECTKGEKKSCSKEGKKECAKGDKKSCKEGEKKCAKGEKKSCKKDGEKASCKKGDKKACCAADKKKEAEKE